MQREILPFLLGATIYALFGCVNLAFAQTPTSYYDWSSTLETTNVLGATSQNPNQYKQFSNYLFGGNFTPASPFYFLKTFQETIQLTFTFDPKQKEGIRIEIAGSRLAEITTLKDQKNSSALADASKNYDQAIKEAIDNLNKLKSSNTDIKDQIKDFDTEFSKHTLVLEEAEVGLSDTNKAALDSALKASWNGIDIPADLAGKPAVPPEVVSRIQALKAQGLLTEEEASKLISLKKRVEARDELLKYVNLGVLPTADFLKMDEGAKALFPDEFNKIHEVKRFYELKKLEDQKPDPAVLNKIQEFSKTYKPGDLVPANIKVYWIPVIRLDELQNTLRPDLIDPNLIKNDAGAQKKFQEVINQFKPRPEDLAYLNSYIQKNPNATLPPEYERMKNLGQKYGAQCGAGQKWISSGASNAVTAGYCVSENSSNQVSFDTSFGGKSCSGAIVSAKASGGTCSAFPSDCIPSGWTKTDSCVQTTSNLANTTASKSISCPSNAHFVPVSYAPQGGYCVPNYTPTTTFSSAAGNGSDFSCPVGYHKNYAGAPCLQDYSSNTTTTSLQPLTTTPGNYPNPFYAPTSACGNGSHWISDPFGGGYCASDSYSPTSGYSQSGFTPYSSTNPYNKDQQESACRAGGGSCDWSSGTCNCKGYSSPAASSAPTYPSACSYPSNGCGSSSYWDSSSCSCKSYSTTTSPGTPPPPPSGYGSCPSGQYWNGSGCVSSSSSTPPSSYTSCPSGQYWNGSSCVSSSYTTPPPPPPPGPPPPPASTTTPPPPPPPGPPPPGPPPPPPPGPPPPPPANPPPPPPPGPPPPP